MMDRRIEKVIDEVLESTRGLMKDPAPNVECNTLWNTWTRRKKLFWLLMHKTPIGKWSICRHRKKLEFVGDRLREFGVDSEVVSEILCDIKDREERWWFESDPKNILMAEMWIRPVKPLDYVTVNFTFIEARKLPDLSGDESHF